jgi:hypothetical protein
MTELNNNWITEGLLDFEYKKYVLLGYLKACRDSFHETKLYPPLGDLVRHYNNLNELSRSLEQLQNAFPKDLKGFDLNKLKLEYERQKGDDEHLQAVNEILEFAIPTMKGAIEEGKEIYEIVEKNIEIQPLGIMPVYNQEGYLFFHEVHSQDVHIFQYQHSVIVSSHENFRSLNLQFVKREIRSIANSFEQIKINLIRTFRQLPQPATYLCTSHLCFPLVETLLPVTKRVLLTKVFP